ncbi:MAG: hypothetical protein WC655_27695 [Candidatus Hydrogenedentales bacterium]|jgi:hypothetical protein
MGFWSSLFVGSLASGIGGFIAGVVAGKILLGHQKSMEDTHALADIRATVAQLVDHLQHSRTESGKPLDERYSDICGCKREMQRFWISGGRHRDLQERIRNFTYFDIRENGPIRIEQIEEKTKEAECLLAEVEKAMGKSF